MCVCMVSVIITSLLFFQYVRCSCVRSTRWRRWTCTVRSADGPCVTCASWEDPTPTTKSPPWAMLTRSSRYRVQAPASEPALKLRFYWCFYTTVRGSADFKLHNWLPSVPERQMGSQKFSTVALGLQNCILLGNIFVITWCQVTAHLKYFTQTAVMLRPDPNLWFCAPDRSHQSPSCRTWNPTWLRYLASDFSFTQGGIDFSQVEGLV